MKTSIRVFKCSGEKGWFQSSGDYGRLQRGGKYGNVEIVWKEILGKGHGIGKDTEAEGAECGECRHSCDGVSGSVRNEVGSLAEWSQLEIM